MPTCSRRCRDASRHLRDALEVADQPIARGLGLGVQAGQLGDLPLPHHDRHEDLLVVDVQVVDARAGDALRVLVEVGDAGARHRERAHLVVDRDHHR